MLLKIFVTIFQTRVIVRKIGLTSLYFLFRKQLKPQINICIKMGSIVVCPEIFTSSKVDKLSCLTFNRRVKKNVFIKGPTNVNHCHVKMMILFHLSHVHSL